MPHIVKTIKNPKQSKPKEQNPNNPLSSLLWKLVKGIIQWSVSVLAILNSIFCISDQLVVTHMLSNYIGIMHFTVQIVHLHNDNIKRSLVIDGWICIMINNYFCKFFLFMNAKQGIRFLPDRTSHVAIHHLYSHIIPRPLTGLEYSLGQRILHKPSVSHVQLLEGKRFTI